MTDSESSSTQRLGDNLENDDTDNDAEEIQVTKKRRAYELVNLYAYELVSSFESLELAKTHLANDRFKWRRIQKNYSTEGDKIFYVCSFSNDCTCAAYILCHNDSLKASLFKSDDEHNHELASTVGIDPRVKEKIQSLYENGVIKPNLIIRALNKQPDFSDLPRFNKGQLSNYLRQLKNSIYGPYTISLNSINEYITNNSVVTESWNKVYIAGSDCHINPPND